MRTTRSRVVRPAHFYPLAFAGNLGVSYPKLKAVYTSSNMLALRFPTSSIFAFEKLSAWTSQTPAPVRLRNGKYSMVNWLGFIDLEEVQESPGKRKPVKLLVTHYSVSVGDTDHWREVPEGMCVQGCLEDRGVYAVMEDGKPRIVPERSKE